MLFASATKRKGIVFDVGTASVSATLFELSNQHHKPRILKTFRRFHKASLHKDALHFSRSTVKQFSRIIEDVHEFTEGSMPELYIIGLASIFYLGKTQKFHRGQRKNAQLKVSEIDSIVEDGRKKFLDDLRREDIIVFENISMKTLLNGYLIESPVGCSADEIDVWLRLSATSRDLYDRLTEIIRSERRDAEIRFSTFPVSTWALMRQTLPKESSAIMVDIGGELTEVTFIADGIITEVLSLPFGVLNVLLRISENERIDLENAFSLLKSYTSGMLESEAERNLSLLIRKEIKRWEQLFERVWQEASRESMVNIKMFFLGGGAFLNDVKTILTPPLLHPDISKGLHVSVVTPEAFREQFEEYCCVEGPGDFGLVSLILNARR